MQFEADNRLLPLYFSPQNYIAPNIDFIEEKTEAQKAEIISSGHSMS